MTKANPIRVLVVDNNKCYASLVREQLEENLKNAAVDIAINIWELKRKIAIQDYRFVIADVSVSLDSAEMKSELESMHVPVYYWSPANNSAKTKTSCDGFSSKPSSLEELKVKMNLFSMKEK